MTQNEALKGLSNQKNLNKQIEIIRSERIKLVEIIKDISFVKTVFPTDSNFVLIRVDDANKRYDQLIKKGIILRNRHGQSLCDNCLRITIGTPSENLKLINALQNI